MKNRHWLLLGFLVVGATTLPAQESPAADTDLKSTLQDARAIPYIDPVTGKMDGYVVESGKTDGQFKDLKIRQGDTLTGRNESPEGEDKSSDSSAGD